MAMLIGTAIISLATGYMLGIGSSIGIIPNPFIAKPTQAGPKSKTSNYDDEEESSEEEVEGVLLDHAPNWANGEAADRRDGLRMSAKEQEKKKWEDSNEECKLVLVVRTDLGMTKGLSLYPLHSVSQLMSLSGKIAAQCSHATLACYKRFLKTVPDSPILKRWERQGQMKVALQVKNEEEMEMLQAKAMSLGLVAEVIADAGRTQIASGSHTVLGIGPAPKSVIDTVTGHLKLL